jgi:hypothetical protein
MRIEKIQKEDSVKKEWFEGLVQKAYVNGWTYSSCTPELWSDYVERWNHFVDYLEPLRANSKLTEIKILIGEAPPFYRANVPTVSRSYFYDPQEIKYTPWFGALYRKFVLEGGNETVKKSKEIKLKELASKGVILIDLFPFPIIQSPEVRMEVTGNFSGWIEIYFKPLLDGLLNCLKCELKEAKFEFGMAATKYAATQFLLGSNARFILSKDSSNILFDNPINHPEFLDISQFHRGEEKIENNALFLPINVLKKDGTIDCEKYNDYFEFVVTIVYSDEWNLFVGDSIGKFVKQKMSVEGFLDELNEKLMKRKLLPIYSADSVMISLEEGVFFNSK